MTKPKNSTIGDATAFRALTLCSGVLVLALGSGCSSAGDGLPTSEPGEPDSARNSTKGSTSGHLVSASTQILEDEASMNLLAQIGLEGRVIKFFEPAEGELLEVEMARTADVKYDPGEDGLTGSALYAYLTKSDAPAALLDAEWRANTAAVRNLNSPELRQPSELDSELRGVETPSRAAPDLRLATYWTQSEVASEDYFTNKYCTVTDRYYGCGAGNGLYCINHSLIQRDKVNMMQAGVQAHRADQPYYGKYNAIAGDTIFSLTVREGWLFGWRKTSGTNAVARSEVDSPDGMYIHCVNYHY